MRTLVTKKKSLNIKPITSSPAPHQHNTSNKPNSIIKSTGEALNLFSDLRFTLHLQKPNTLAQQLSNKITHCKNTLLRKGYSEEIVLITEYFLSACFDASIEKTQWGDEHHWHEQYALTSHIPNIDILEPRIPLLLNKMIDTPHLFTDVLEFCFMCLKLSPEFPLALNKDTDVCHRIFNQLVHEKGELSNALYRNSKHTVSNKHQVHISYPWIRNTLIITGFTLCLTYVALMFNKPSVDTNTVNINNQHIRVPEDASF